MNITLGSGINRRRRRETDKERHIEREGESDIKDWREKETVDIALEGWEWGR